MNYLATPEFWSMVSSGVSIVLGIVAVILTIWFFVLSKQSEHRVVESLTKIETQAGMLEQITGKQLDRLTKFVTQPPQNTSDRALAELIPILKDLPTQLIRVPAKVETADINALKHELALAYGALYFYVAQTNFWGQLNLPSADEYDQNLPIQSEAKAVVDLSALDFATVAGILTRINPEVELKGTTIEPLFQRTKDFWRTLVRNSADVFVLRVQQREKSG